MSATQEPQERTPARSVDTAQYIVCAVLVAVGGFLIYDALSLAAGFAKVDPVGPRMFPIADRDRVDRAGDHLGHRDPARLDR